MYSTGVIHEGLKWTKSSNLRPHKMKYVFTSCVVRFNKNTELHTTCFTIFVEVAKF